MRDMKPSVCPHDRPGQYARVRVTTDLAPGALGFRDEASGIEHQLRIEVLEMSLQLA